MKRMGLFGVAFLVAVVAFVSVPRAGAQPSKVASTPQWEQIKSLVGEWDGYMEEGGKKLPTRVKVRLTGDGSAVMHVLDEGGPQEMVTMFHMDGTDLLATHYCAAHNQPRMRAVKSSEPKQVSFKFKDGTNIAEGQGAMRELAVTFVDADHHNEAWGYGKAEGPLQTGMFYLTRVKASTTK